MSENIILLLVGVLVFLVLILVGVILYLFKKVMENNKEDRADRVEREERHNRINEIAAELKASAPSHDDLAYCANHPQDHAHGMCNICQSHFCEDCVKEHDGLSFCAPHFKLYVSHEWVELENIKTTPETPETAFPIYDFKKELWKEEQTPAIISTHYKINIEIDCIESYVKLLVRADEHDELKGRYQVFKQ